MSVPSHRPHRSLFRPIPGILMSVAAAIGFATSGVHGELTEIPPSEFARFGTEVASDGASFLAAAAMQGSIGGRVQVFRGSPSAAWSLFDTLEASDSSFDDQFGLSIATYKGTSDLDPYLFAIGAPGHSERRGAVYIFAISGLEFVEVAKIMSPFPEASAAFGYQTALSPDGKYLAVTAPRDRLGCPSCGQGLGPGNVYIYKRHPKLGWGGLNRSLQHLFGSHDPEERRIAWHGEAFGRVV